jgi:hypothetical protein
MAALAFGLGPDSVAQHVMRAAGLLFTGAVLTLSLFLPGRPFGTAVAAGVIAAAGIVTGSAVLDVGWEAFQASVRTQLEAAAALLPGAAALPADRQEAMRRLVAHAATVYPAIALLGAIAGGTLAVAIAAHVSPRGPTPPRPFAAFRFNDHLVWGALVALALALTPLPSPWKDVVVNVLFVWAGLYLARGAAVLISIWTRWPISLRVALCVAAVLLLHFALPALLLVGLADTWIDFRRRTSPPDRQGAHT